MRARRLPSNPIITPERMNGVPGDNINGPSLIRVPQWVKNPLGKYYLYFAHHKGKSIRLACADDLAGPWTVYTPGVLQVEQTVCRRHIASPDVLVDEDQQRFRMYFHGPALERGQYTFLACSSDGLHFTPQPQVLGPYYFRVFEHAGASYAVARGDHGGLLLRSSDGITPFERGPDILPRMRHAAVRRAAPDRLEIFYSRLDDNPERILMSPMSLAGDWRNWHGEEPIDILHPEEPWEGANEPAIPSTAGPAIGPMRQLRDPALFEENGRRYLLYSVAAEQGIAIAELNI